LCKKPKSRLPPSILLPFFNYLCVIEKIKERKNGK
jgi:hypothetical protein